MLRLDLIKSIEEAVSRHNDDCPICRALTRIRDGEQVKRPDGATPRFRREARRDNALVATELIKLIDNR